MATTIKYEIVEIFVIYQPHKAQSSSLQEIQKALSDETLFSDISVQPLSAWQQQGDRVWSRIYKGSFPSASEVYDIRRKHLPSYLQTPAIDIVALPLDSAPPAAPSSSTSTSVAGPRRAIRLAVFDMDSTLIEQEVIDELARAIGKYDEVAAITERAMQGHLDFAGSLRERVALLRGLPHDVWETVKPRISFSAGARQLCRELKRQGATLAVLSGGFTPLAEWLKAELGLDVAHANFLASDPPNDEFAFEHLSGRLVEGRQIVTAERKRELLLDLARQHGCPVSQVLCVGDGANDLNMLGEVGQGGGVAIALKAKPKVQEAAPNKLNSESMADILYLLGYSQQEIEAQGSS